jgi:hypothetical protein
MTMEDLDALISPNLETYLDSCSLEEIEALAIDRYKKINEDHGSYLLRRVMDKRCERINAGFTWSDESKEKIIQLNDQFFDLFKKAYDEAVSSINDITQRIKKNKTIFKSNYTYVILELNFASYREIHEVLLNAGSYLQYSRIGDVKGLVLYDFEQDPGSYLFNREDTEYGNYFGDIFSGVKLSHVFCDLILGKWSDADIVSINHVSATVRIEKSYWKEMDGWKE